MSVTTIVCGNQCKVSESEVIWKFQQNNIGIKSIQERKQPNFLGQPYPQTSVDFISLFNIIKDAKIIDIGGGDDHLTDALLELGYKNILQEN